MKKEQNIFYKKFTSGIGAALIFAAILFGGSNIAHAANYCDSQGSCTGPTANDLYLAERGLNSTYYYNGYTNFPTTPYYRNSNYYYQPYTYSSYTQPSWYGYAMPYNQYQTLPSVGLSIPGTCYSSSYGYGMSSGAYASCGNSYYGAPQPYQAGYYTQPGGPYMYSYQYQYRYGY